VSVERRAHPVRAVTVHRDLGPFQGFPGVPGHFYDLWHPFPGRLRRFRAYVSHVQSQCRQVYVAGLRTWSAARTLSALEVSTDFFFGPSSVFDSFWGLSQELLDVF